MFKSIKNLAVVYFRENWLRDALTITIFSIVIFIFYSLFTDKGVEWIRKMVIWAWATTVTVYTTNAFNGYGDVSKSYLKLLLPASIEAKFVWEWFRTLILFGGITLGLLFAADAPFEYIAKQYAPSYFLRMASARSLTEMLLVRNEPLNYLPVMMYITVLWHSAALLMRTRMNMFIARLVMVSAWVLIVFLPIGDGRSLLYPFISQQEQWGFLSIQLSWASRSTEYLLSYIWLGVLPIALYLLSYFRIKESEIS